jgi:Arc/MetJ-type ribon-helix-helix transcriptional regulator
MSHELSPQAEQFLDGVVAGGLFPSKEAALEAAVEALRARTDPGMIPAVHMELVEQAIESALAGRVRPWTDADWDGLRKLAEDAAAKSTHSNR